MRIIHCAPFNLFTKTGGSLYSNPVKISLGLVESGHFVHNFDYRDSSRFYSFFKSKKGGVRKMNALFSNLINEIKPDLIIFGHAELIEEEIFYKLKKQNIKMIFWYNDMIIDNLFRNVGHLFDKVFITGAGEIINELKKINDNSFFLPNPVHKSIECNIGYKNNHEFDLMFSGRKDNERKKLISFMETTFDNIKVKYIGQTTENTIIGNDYFNLISNSKIVLNHSRDNYMVNKWYTSDRLMHILGNGTFCLSRTIINGEDFFEDKLDYYNTENELKEKVFYYLENVEERNEKTQWLHKRVHELFSSCRVSSYILDVLNEDEKKLIEYEWYK
jgi:spore maturation protein CgeB